MHVRDRRGADRDKSARQGGAQDKAGDDEALGLVDLLGHVGVVGAHDSGGSGVAGADVG